MAAVYLALLAAAVGIMVGWHSRVCAAVVFVALTSLARANPYVFNSGDTLIRVLAFYLMLAPSGMEFSLDRRRARQQGRDVASTHPAWPLRLIQIQVSVMYASAVWSKLQGAAWRDGTAVSFATRLPDLVRFRGLGAHGAVDAASHSSDLRHARHRERLALLIWFPRTRVPALAAGVLLHLSIDASIRVGFFTLAVFTAYLSFADPPGSVRNTASALARARKRALATPRGARI